MDQERVHKGWFFSEIRNYEFIKRTSTTVSLNFIREDEEATKGWRKGEIAIPYEFQDLKAVHIIPFVDLGRLLIVLVTRTIALSNTQYSLLLESGGRLLNLAVSGSARASIINIYPI